MDVNNQRKPLLYYWLIALLIMGVINMFFLPFMTKNTIEQVNYDVFLTQMQNKNISQAEVNEDVIYFYRIKQAQQFFRKTPRRYTLP